MCHIPPKRRFNFNGIRGYNPEDTNLQDRFSSWPAECAWSWVSMDTSRWSYSPARHPVALFSCPAWSSIMINGNILIIERVGAWTYYTARLLTFWHIIHLFSSPVFTLNFGDEKQVIKTQPRIRNAEEMRADGSEGWECVSSAHSVSDFVSFQNLIWSKICHSD